MKLRNKKTGEIKSIEEIIREAFLYNELDSLKNIDTNWEEIEPKEPLIKDPKIRKAVKAWADANDIRYGRRCNSKSSYSKRIVGWNSIGTSFTIEFDKDLKMYGDSITKDCYTVTELCGEEEE